MYVFKGVCIHIHVGIPIHMSPDCRGAQMLTYIIYIHLAI